VNVAVVGATGAVGETIVRLLEERDLPIARLSPFASRARSDAVRFRGASLDVRVASDDALRGFDVVFFASGEDASARYAPALVERGSVVIDNSATFRMQRGVPLIVPDVNAEVLRAEHRLFPVANCTAIVLCTALRPIRDVAGLRSVHVATYQAASGAGRPGIEELLAGEEALERGETEPSPVVFARSLARNVVPQIGPFDASGLSGEERKVRDETRKLLELPELAVNVMAVRVPVLTAHSEAVFLETQRAATLDALGSALDAAPGVVFHRDGIVTPREVEGTDDVHVARLRALRQAQGDTALRQDDDGTEFALWCVGDQLRRGAATNAVQILELLLAKGFVAA
jgi:aspartate-semialdehyde dehydrogenase